MTTPKRSYGTGTLYIGKDGCWWARWHTVDRRRPHRNLGPARSPGKRAGLTRKDAEGKLRELMLGDNAGEASRGGAPTVEQAGRALLSRLERRGRKPSTLETVRGHLRTHIDHSLLGRMPVSEVVERDVDRLIETMQAHGSAPKTVRNVVGTLHSLFELALRERYIDRNPCHLAELPTVERSSELRFLTPEELERVVSSPPDESCPRQERDQWPTVRVLILTAAMTGMRLGELRALRWQDLGSQVRVTRSITRGRYGTPKSGHARSVPAAGRLIDELGEHLKVTPWSRDDDLVFAHPHTGNPLHASRSREHFQSACRRAGVPVIRFHDLRHTFATTLAASGRVGTRELQEWMGHAHASTTAIYTHFMPAERQAELIDGAFTRQTAEPREGAER